VPLVFCFYISRPGYLFNAPFNCAQRLAAWRRAGEHNCSRGCERLKVRQDFLRAYTPPCAKPLVVCSCILLYFIVLSLRKAPIMKFQHLFCFVSIFENLERCQYFLLLQLDKYLFRKFFHGKWIIFLDVFY
jgi:hypothetical protein